VDTSYVLSEGPVEFGGDRTVYRIVTYNGLIQEVRPGNWHHRTLSAIFCGLPGGMPGRLSYGDGTFRDIVAQSKITLVMALYDPECYYGRLLRRIVRR